MNHSMDCRHRYLVGTFEVRVPTHVALRMFIMQILASQLPFLNNRIASPLLIGVHVAPLSGPTVYSVYCGSTAHSL